MSARSALHAYVGTFELRGQSAGIHVIRFNTATGAVERKDLVPLPNPSHLAIANRAGLLFAAAHTSHFEGEPGGAVVAFRIDPASGGLIRLNHRIVPFPHPNYIIVDREEGLILTTAGLGGGLNAFPIAYDGSVAPASANLAAAGEPMLKLGETVHAMDVNEFLARRGRSTSPHAIILDPSNQFAVVTDAGRDRLLLYVLDREQGTLELLQELTIEKVGAGPRHAVFHPGGERLYVVNEAHSSVTIFAFNRNTSCLTERATVLALPAERMSGNAMGDVKIDRTGRFLYCSNRGDESITLFSVKADGDSLQLIETTPCGGIHPRGLCLSPNGKFLLVANQGPGWRVPQEARPGTPDAGIAVFAIDVSTGKLTRTGHSAQIDAATCVAFSDAFAPS